ncbi:MAG: sodium:solute symporter family transporter, partial [Panacagrimonas sp.]
MNAVLASVLVYIVLQLAYVWYASRRVRNETDYLIAGRQLGPWMATFTVFATWFGAETCIGAAGQAYESGLSGVKVEPFGYAAGIILTGLLLGAALWRRGLLTIADLYRQRYGAGVERMAAIIMIPTSLLWAAAQIRAFGQVLAASSELGVMLAITLAAVVVIIYTAAGGMWADATSDLVHGIVLIAGLLVIFGLFLHQDGFSQVAALPAERLALRGEDESWLAILESLAVPICGTLVAQELIARMLAMRSPQLARRATVSAGFLYLAIGLIPVMLGLIAAPMIGDLDEPEQVILHVAQSQLG